LYLYEQFILQSGVHLIGNDIFTICLSSFDVQPIRWGGYDMWKAMKKSYFVCLTVNLEFLFIWYFSSQSTQFTPYKCLEHMIVVNLHRTWEISLFFFLMWCYECYVILKLRESRDFNRAFLTSSSATLGHNVLPGVSLIDPRNNLCSVKAPVLLCYIRFSWYLLIKHC